MHPGDENPGGDISADEASDQRQALQDAPGMDPQAYFGSPNGRGTGDRGDERREADGIGFE